MGLGYAEDRLPCLQDAEDQATQDAKASGHLQGSVETHTNTLGSSGSHTGVIAGIGAEYAVNDSVTVRAEYLHGEFDDERYSFPEDALHTHDIEFNTDVVRVGLIWTLN